MKGLGASNDESIEEDADYDMYQKVFEDLKRNDIDIKLSDISAISSDSKSNNTVAVVENKDGLLTTSKICLKITDGGLIGYLIELKNELISVHYVDAWFVCSTCVYNCGLTTLDSAKLSRASQILLMFATFFSGFTMSTLPALVIKTRTHKKVEGITVDNDHGDEKDDSLPQVNLTSNNLSSNVTEKLRILPTAKQLRYRAYMLTIFLTLITRFTIYGIAFVVIGAW
ncbi:unnamed protein product, partial [Didymodactylos carnosus]